MSAMPSQITGVLIVYPTVCSGADQREHESSASLAFTRGIHRWPVNSPHKGPVTQKLFPSDDIIMNLDLVTTLIIVIYLQSAIQHQWKHPCEQSRTQIETRAKWSPSAGDFFQIHFYERMCLSNQISLNCFSKGLVDKKSAPAVHDDVIKWKPFHHYWPFVGGIHRSPVDSPHKGQWHGALMFSLVCAWTNGWGNNRNVGDLRRHCAHYDDTVMGYG